MFDDIRLNKYSYEVAKPILIVTSAQLYMATVAPYHNEQTQQIVGAVLVVMPPSDYTIKRVSVSPGYSGSCTRGAVG